MVPHWSYNETNIEFKPFNLKFIPTPYTLICVNTKEENILKWDVYNENNSDNSSLGTYSGCIDEVDKFVL